MRQQLCVLSILALTIGLIPMAEAGKLKDAKRAGWAVETSDGYVRAKTTDAQITQMIEEVNSKRRKIYQRIAQETGDTVETVGRLHAEKRKKKNAAKTCH